MRLSLFFFFYYLQQLSSLLQSLVEINGVLAPALIKEEVDATVGMEKQPRDEEGTKKGEDVGVCVNPRGPVWWLGALGGLSGGLH